LACSRSTRSRDAIWSLIPLASRTVTVTTNSDKTAYPGTVKSIQHGTISVRARTRPPQSSTIGAVDTVESPIIIPLGSDWSGSVSDEHYVPLVLLGFDSMCRWHPQPERRSAARRKARSATPSSKLL
jgi:hypothetical protein